VASSPFYFITEQTTAAQVSIDRYGADYSDNPDAIALKLTLHVDMARINDASTDIITGGEISTISITGGELDLNLDWSQFESFTYQAGGTINAFESINNIDTPSVWQSYADSNTGAINKIVVGSIDESSTPALTLVDNVDSSGLGVTDRPSTMELGSIYLKPTDINSTIDLSFEGLVVTNEASASLQQASETINIYNNINEDNNMSITTMDFNTALFDMYDSTGGRVGGANDVHGSMTIDMATGAGTATVASNQDFFGFPWTAHDITVQMSADGSTATFNMLFDWNGNIDIPVTLDTAITYNADNTMSFTALDTDGDGIVGHPMTEGAFAGFSAAFSGMIIFSQLVR